MLNENIKLIRKSKGLSQEELAVRLNVVRQTVSKWEKGLSVPDSEMLISISEALETPISTLLGETVIEAKADDLKVISEKLEIINLQLAQRKNTGRKVLQGLLISVYAVTAAIFIALLILNSPYLSWDYSDPENSVVGVVLHAFEWTFVKLSPIILIAAIVGIVITRKKNNERYNLTDKFENAEVQLMKVKNPMLVVTDIDKSVEFYKKVFGLHVIMDFGANKTLTGGLALQTLETWREFIGTDDIYFGGNSSEVYFEEDDFDAFTEKLKKCDVKYVHPVKEHSWGQRVVRIYDPDKHIIEIGENIKVVCKRFLDSGMTPEQVAERMDVPIKFVNSCMR